MDFFQREELRNFIATWYEMRESLYDFLRHKHFLEIF